MYQRFSGARPLITNGRAGSFPQRTTKDYERLRFPFNQVGRFSFFGPEGIGTRAALVLRPMVRKNWCAHPVIECLFIRDYIFRAFLFYSRKLLGLWRV